MKALSCSIKELKEALNWYNDINGGLHIVHRCLRIRTKLTHFVDNYLLVAIEHQKG